MAEGSSLLGGGSLTRRPGCFTADGQHVALCSGSLVRLYSAASGLPHVELRGHGGEVTAVTVRPSARSAAADGPSIGGGQLVSCSLDGTIRVWEQQSASYWSGGGEAAGGRSRTFAAPGPVEHLVLPPAPSAFAYVSVHHAAAAAGAEPSGRVLCLSLANGSVVGESLAKTSSPVQLALSAPGRLLACVERSVCSVWDVSGCSGARNAAAAASALARGGATPLRLRHTKPLVCCAVDPIEERVAAGDATGRLLVWHGVRGALAAAAAAAHLHPSQAAAAAAQPATLTLSLSTLHWHSSALLALAFSPDGQRLLSGGREGVLVLWRAADGGRTFLPRLGAPLVWFAQSPLDAAVVVAACADNVVHVGLNTATLHAGTPVRGARPALYTSMLMRGAEGAGKASHAAEGWGEQPASPLWDARTRSALLPSAGGALQWYDVSGGKTVGTLDVCDSARQPPPPPVLSSAAARALQLSQQGQLGSRMPLPPRPLEPHVAHAQLGCLGESLVTVERRGEGCAGGAPGGGFAFTAVADTVRFWGLVGGEEGGEEEEGAASGSGTSGRFALSTRAEQPHGPHPVSALAHHPTRAVAATSSAGAAQFKVWVRCAPGSRPAARAPWRVRSVGFYQDRPMHCVAFSSDGSLLAVGAGSAVTLWDPESNALLRVLHSPPGPAAAPQSQHLTHLAFTRGAEGAPPLLFSAAAGGGGALRFWNLLTLQLHRSHAPLGGRIVCVAADEASDAVAVAMVPSAGGGGGPQQPSLLLFSGADATLTASWVAHLDGGASASDARLLFAPRSQLFPVAASSQALSGSALLLVTDDRRFVLAPQPADDALLDGGSAERGAVQAAARAADAAAAEAAGGAGVGLERSFGSLRVVQGGAAAQSFRPEAAAGGGASWASPFRDVPSHALPTLVDMLPAYLDALVRGEGVTAK